MGVSRFRNGLRERRVRAGLQQRELARRVGLSRQALGSLEAGETVPATSTALELARALGCRVEDLFWLGDEQTPLEAVLAAGGEGSRVAVGSVGDRWVAHPLDGDRSSAFVVPADGVVVKGPRQAGGLRVRPLREAEALRGNVLAAGCDPALGLLGGHLSERFPAGRLHWVEAGSTAALEMLARGEVHLAGLHLFDEESGQYNVGAVRRRFPGRAMVLVNLAVWELGLVVAAGNPRRIRDVTDLARRGVRLVGREPGTGAQELLLRLAAEQGVPRRSIRVVGVAGGHAGVAAAIAAGAGDVGVATRAAASARGLDFVPLSEARFDLVLAADGTTDRRIEQMRDVLASPRFRRDLGGLPGYGTTRTGKVVAEVAP
jgi:molybdate-binding protein/DNA-binding XRE family transcriptional regulator